ncbi:hypothetical protein DIPPA_28000 [Diplonema papillatum]|nr:hypothetical protein DIPPA_28000 [Diplonema papillatum]
MSSDDVKSTATPTSDCERSMDIDELYAKIDLRSLKSGGHNRCWKFITHPEGWVDNMGVIFMVAVPVMLFSVIMSQESFPPIFVLGLCNTASIAASLFMLVPASRKLSTYRSLKSAARLLSYDTTVTPNSYRHMFILGSFIFQLLVLGAVVLTECRIVLHMLLPVQEDARQPDGSHTLFYKFADVLSSSLLGNLFTLTVTTLTATFFGFSWFICCFKDR